MTYDISRKYRTIRSMSDEDVDRIMTIVERYKPKTFLDYGCHFGHLSIELALRYDITIYSVDNFTGTIDDAPMKKLIDEATPDGDFFSVFWKNVKEAEEIAGGYRGRIISVRTEALHRVDEKFDMVFIDSSHRVEEAQEFIQISSMLKPYGIMGGHDFDFEGVQAGIKLIEDRYRMLWRGYTWFMKKRGFI